MVKEEQKPRDVNEIIQKATDVLQRVGAFEQKKAQQPQQIQVPQVPQQEPRRAEPAPYSYDVYKKEKYGEKRDGFKMNIKIKMLLGFLVVAILVGVVGYFAVYSSSHHKELSDEVIKHTPHLEAQHKMSEDVDHLFVAVDHFVLLQQPQHKDEYYRIKEGLEETYEQYHKVSCLEGKPMLVRWHTLVEKIEVKLEEGITLVEQGEEMNIMAQKIEEAHDIAEEADKLIDDIIEHEFVEHIDPAEAAITAGVSNSIMISIVLSIVAILIAIIVGFFLSNSISKPITYLKDMAQEIGRGNLDLNIYVKTGDETQELAESFNKMTKDLKTNREQIVKSNEELTVTNEELQKSKVELEAHKAELEKKVAERTKELENAKLGLESQVRERTRQLEASKLDLEKQVETRTAELQTKLEQLEKFSGAATEREMKMIELKKKVKELEEKLGEKA